MSFTKGFREGFQDLGIYIQTIVNFASLLFIYIFGVGITSLIAKTAGKKFLNIKKTYKKTYWEDYNLSKEKEERYYRQF
jgi:hypothetical protein